MSTPFPKKSVVWSGAILGGIVHAVKCNEVYFVFGSWSCNHYVLNGVDGREGVITFAGGHWYPDAPLVAVFHNIHGGRFRIPEKDPLELYFRGCPPYQRSLAEQLALPYLRSDHHGIPLHRVTAAFWDEGEYVTAADPWDLVLANGADLLSDEFIEDREAAFAALRTNSGLSPDEEALARSLFERKMASPAAGVEMTPAEAAWVAERAGNETFLERCRQRFEEIGIYMPNS
jgi:hypothetical protein